MRILINLFLLIAIAISVNADDKYMDILSEQKQIEQSKNKELKSLQAYKELESSLKQALALGDKSKSFILATLYMNEFPFLTKKMQEENKFKSIEYFNISLNSGYGLSAYFLSMNYLSKQKIDDSLLVLEQGMKCKAQSVQEDKLLTDVLLSVAYNVIVLDFKADKELYIYKALDLTYPISQKINKSTLDFTIANLLYIANKTDEANKYLNTACNNPDVDKKILNLCKDM